MDLVKSAIKHRFDQKGFRMLQQLERVLTVPLSQQSNTINEVIFFYGGDLSHNHLETLLDALHTTIGSTLTDLVSPITYPISLKGREEYYSKVIEVAKLILVMPAVNIASERSSSGL